jgi:hypothetical protein
MIRSQRAILLLLIFFFITAIHAFIPLQQKVSRHLKHNLAFFDGWFGFNNNDPQEPSEGKAVDVDGIYTGSKRIITIPGK